MAVLISSKNRKLRVSDFFIFVFSNNPELLLYWKINSFSTDMVHFTRCFSVFVNFCHFENQLIFSNIWTYTRKFSPHEIPHLPDLSHFTRFVNKTRFVNTFLENENVTNRRMHCIKYGKICLDWLSHKFDFNKRYRYEIEESNEKYSVDLTVKFPKNRFFSIWCSQRPPASVRVNKKSYPQPASSN